MISRGIRLFVPIYVLSSDFLSPFFICLFYYYNNTMYSVCFHNGFSYARGIYNSANFSEYL